MVFHCNIVIFKLLRVQTVALMDDGMDLKSQSQTWVLVLDDKVTVVFLGTFLNHLLPQ